MGKFAGKPAGEICWGNLLGKFPWNSARKICWENLLGNLLGKSCQGGITFEGYFCRKSPGISPGFRRPQAARSAIFIIIENNYKPAAGADFFLGHIIPQFLVNFKGVSLLKAIFAENLLEFPLVFGALRLRAAQFL